MGLKNKIVNSTLYKVLGVDKPHSVWSRKKDYESKRKKISNYGNANTIINANTKLLIFIF